MVSNMGVIIVVVDMCRDVLVYGCAENCCFLLYLQLCFFDGDAGANGIERYAKKIVQYRLNEVQKYTVIVHTEFAVH